MIIIFHRQLGLLSREQWERASERAYIIPGTFIYSFAQDDHVSSLTQSISLYTLSCPH